MSGFWRGIGLEFGNNAENPRKHAKSVREPENHGRFRDGCRILAAAVSVRIDPAADRLNKNCGEAAVFVQSVCRRSDSNTRRRRQRPASIPTERRAKRVVKLGWMLGFGAKASVRIATSAAAFCAFGGRYRARDQCRGHFICG